MQKIQLVRNRLKPAVPALCAALLLLGATAARADGLPDMGGSGSAWRVDTFYENDTHVRQGVGLSKFRNTLQVEADKDLGGNGTFSSLKIRTKLRGTYDGVYSINDRRYGKKAGGPIMLENGDPGLQALAPFLPPALGTPSSVPQGGGIINHSSVAGLAAPLGAPFLAGNTFADGYPTAQGALNGNDGMIVLGSRLGGIHNGVSFGVPVRPCDVDSRGCIKDYMDAKRHDLESPEFNDRLDFIREAYIVAKMPLDNGAMWNFQVGKQQVIWGRTDLFRVLDVINPMDYSRNNIYDEMQDIRIPMWIATAEYRMGTSELFEDNNLQFVWNFDKFRPSNLGQGGTPNQILDAGDFFRGMKNLWDNGGTVANFALAGPGNPGYATNFGPGQIGIRQANLPEWSLANTQFGVKWEGAIKGVSFSLNALTYRSQLPSLRNLYSKGVQTMNPFTGALQPSPYIIAFDIDFPRVKLIGASADIQADSIGSTFRVETALTSGEEFPNTARSSLYSDSHVWRYVIGWDRPTFIPFLSTTRAFFLSAQLFGQNILNHELHNSPWGKTGMPDWKMNNIATFLIKGWFKNDQVSPQLLMAHDFRASASVASPSVEWLVTDNLKFNFGANYKFGDGSRQFDDSRSTNPWAPFTGLQGPAARPNPFDNSSLGLAGVEPLGRFRSGPIGMAMKENELFVSMRYKF
ncbi:conserved exported protein of unknown function [Georgfuchsia toluolica]|uniref:DUF1302 domain-containing protein n=1 Tax=Georgfuchsia toluolica TaxID=424218 RepID=A0A916NGF8_9PROT|nr:DUF1302 family protein [Georgfuchsia toluolica]CAG4882142.1 conserved exported protein of unknown function [Georgfuchsia toluolica]